jgi:Anti-sigma factor NepR
MEKLMGSRDSSGPAAARGLGWLLRAQYDRVMREPLPARWTELINCLDEKERARLKSELNYGEQRAPLRN